MVCSSFSLRFDIFKAFYDRYTRAAEIVEQVFGITTYDVFRRCSRSRCSFESWKFLCKSLHIVGFCQELGYSKEGLVGQAAWRQWLLHQAWVWERDQLTYCPRLATIHLKYLTEFKHFAAALPKKG